MADEFDVVVVGSGPGGLTAGATLAATGKRVLVVEQHDIAGGNCTVFRRDEFEFDVGLHYVGECAPGGVIYEILRGLGVADKVAWRPLEHEFDRLVYPDFEFNVPASWSEYRERAAEQLPNEAENVIGAFEVLEAVAAVSRFGGDEATRALAAPWRHKDMQSLLDHFDLSVQAQAIITYMSGLYASRPRDTSIAMHAGVVAHYMSQGAFYLVGGGQVLPARLVEVIEHFGGEVRAKTRVDRILIEDGIARGVMLKGGDEIRSSIVVSNADYCRTMLELVGQSHLSEEVASFARDAVMTLPLISAYVVVDFEIDQPNSNLTWFSSYDPDEAYRSLEDGSLDGGLAGVFMAFASVKDPENPHLCRPGQSNFQIMALAPRGYGVWGVDDGPTHGRSYRRQPTYRQRKAELTDALIAAAEQMIGPFRDHIVHCETSTPLSQERYTLSTGGTSYGLQHSPAQTGARRPHYRTEIPGLFLVGASTTYGHGIAGTMAGGVVCAGEILGVPDLMPRLVLGETLVGPDELPPDGPDWDPMEVSRGAALRERRAAGRKARAAAQAGQAS